MATLTDPQITSIEKWAKEYILDKDLPSDFDIEIAVMNAIDNAYDVDPSIAEDCAKLGVISYVDQKTHMF